jgi:cytochrome o ubiquinol oxidase subunit II
MSKKSKRLKLKVIVPLVAALAVVALAVWYLRGVNIPVMQPQGSIGHKERNLMVFTVLLGLLIIVPVFIMTIVIAWRYREDNTKARAKYTPEWDRHRLAEFTWWAIPFAIIAVLSVVTWTSTHDLDPWKPLASSAKTMKIQVVSLDWKWLFIYPEQQIATVNFVQFPAGTPVDFEITSDSVMNSFWIPQLGSQIYSMPGMSTHVHLVADKNGDYRGSSANISGEGFAGMKFVARASSRPDFDKWVQSVAHDSTTLTNSGYNQLAKPSKDNPRAFYALGDKKLYDTILGKYMASMHHESPQADDSDRANIPAMNHHEDMYMETTQ